MSKSGIKYRIKQKLKYHFSSDEIEKRIADINRYEEIILLDKETFSIKGDSNKFDINKHAFLLQNINIFQKLSEQDNIKILVSEGHIYCLIDELKIDVYTAEEIFIIKEIWIDGTYNLDSLQLNECVVMDVGMNVGMASLFFSTKEFVRKIYAYEPFKPTFEIAKLNIGLNKNLQNKIEFYNYGMSSKNEEIEVEYSSDHRGRTGIWGTDLVLDQIESSKKEKLELRDFNTELERIIEENPDSPLVLKIDCEGSEYDIFRSLNEALLKPVKCILMEWHKRGPDEIVKKLKSNGFSLLSFNSKSKKVGMIYAFK
ncbi:FkbM family methyltransferase [Hyphobacterium sp. CCMP332]|nr:FkbM family methyltransferase [Hyphobacterium sp. CCMP332]